MRILVADKLDTRPLEQLEVLGAKISYQPDLEEAALPGALKDVGVLVVRSTKVSRKAIESAGALGLIVRAGAGVNNIDVEAASERGVYVSNCPGRNAAAVAELAMGHVLALDRRLVDATVALREGRWNKSELSDARGLMGRRFGVAGLGSIGRLVLERARGFGMQLYAWSRSLSAGRARELGVAHCSSLVELAQNSDVLSIHLPLTSLTRGAVDKRVLEALPERAIFVNTSRAEIVDHAALAEAVKTKKLRVGLDVWDDEPKDGKGQFRPALLDAGVVYGTPHIGASTDQAQEAIASEVARIVRSFLTEEELPNVVNVCKTTPARYALVLRSRDRPGVLANVLSVIKRHGINVEEVSNTIFQGAVAACTKMRLSGRPGEDCLQEIRAFEEVLHVDVIALPNLA
jgi:D-3-phosphoglycerate dehydrogenase / 2-oxoglutarate reductase